jgi:hypothetical protein
VNLFDIVHIDCTFVYVDATILCIEIGFKGEIDLKNDFGIVRKIKISRFWISYSFSSIFEGYLAMSKVNCGNLL